MKVYTSYFYQVRFFTPNMIPFSTACFDPKWFHDSKGIFYQFKNSKNVWNGLRVNPLVPGDNCKDDCKGLENCICKNPSKCNFLRHYREQLDALDFNKVFARLQAIANQIKEDEGFEEEPIIVLLIYEAPSNNCSERWPIQSWFRDNGVEIEEWRKS